MKPKSHTTLQGVFATACFSRPGLVSGRVTTVPASQVHAKTMGTTTTLCGQSAVSWFKFWEVPFATVPTDRCPRCADAFVQRLASGS